MKCDSLEMLIRQIYYGIMQDSYDRQIEMSFDNQEIIMTVFENEIPIKIHFEDVYYEDGTKHNKLTAEVYTELCRVNIGAGWLKELDDICRLIEENEHIFRVLFEKGSKKNG